MANNHLLFNALFERSAAADDTRQFLVNLTKEYPYFSTAQFYLLQHTDKKSPEYNIAAAKAAIHFNNPLWLNFQVENFEKIALPADKSAIEAIIQNEPNTVSTNEDSISETGVQKVFDVEKMIVVETVKLEPVALLPEAASDELATTANVAPEQAPVNADKLFTSTYPEDDYPEDYPEEEESAEKEIEPMNIRLDFTNTSNTTEDTILFEPLHTSDYFASLGIKFTGEIKPDDKFGTQLKSFTSWLKTMKKIHVEDLPESSDHSHISIQQMAEQSNQDAAVLTEAMAEVLLQQGKTVKAIEVFEKLSLHNPAKKAYFAAKIDNINR